MVLMKYFCFVFPVRLGVIITAVISIVQNLVLLGASLYYSADDIKQFAEGLRDKSKDNMYDSKAKEAYEILIENVRDYSVEFRWFFIALSSACIGTSGINIIAAMSKLRWLSVPYILVGFIEIAAVLTIHVNSMLMMKKNWNLGILIAASCAGGFTILFLLYLWGVSVAMFQIIGIVNSKEYRENSALLMRQSAAEETRKQRQRNIVTIAADIYYDTHQEMLARDFYGLYRKNFRKI